MTVDNYLVDPTESQVLGNAPRQSLRHAFLLLIKRPKNRTSHLDWFLAIMRT